MSSGQICVGSMFISIAKGIKDMEEKKKRRFVFVQMPLEKTLIPCLELARHGLLR